MMVVKTEKNEQTPEGTTNYASSLSSETERKVFSLRTDFSNPCSTPELDLSKWKNKLDYLGGSYLPTYLRSIDWNKAYTCAQKCTVIFFTVFCCSEPTTTTTYYPILDGNYSNFCHTKTKTMNDSTTFFALKILPFVWGRQSS